MRRMGMENIEVARTFDEVADLLEIQGANPFRVRAYRTASRTVGTLNGPVESLIRQNGHRLEALPGIGADLAGKIERLCRTGQLPLLEQLKKKTPESLVTLLRIPGIGPKRAKLIYKKLGVRTLGQLEKAARAGRLSKVRGLGPAIQQAILRGLEQDKSHSARVPIAEAEAYVRPLVAALRAAPGVERLDVAGSFRRRAETVGDVDILVAAEEPATVARAFVTFKDVKHVNAHGDTRCAVVLRSGLAVDLRIVPSACYGAALYYFTGSKAHNIEIRGLAHEAGAEDQRVRRLPTDHAAWRGRTEEDVYAALGPAVDSAGAAREPRRDRSRARRAALPQLVELGGHPRRPPRAHRPRPTAATRSRRWWRHAPARGYEYVAITDHTKAVRVAGGLTAGAFRRRRAQIDALQKKFPGLAILKGAEVDILDDGSLDLDEAALAALDVVIVAVHSRFNMSQAAMTRRLVRAMRAPARRHILGHPTGRLLGRREPYPVDMEEIVKVAREEGVMLEINAQPERLDLHDLHVRMAREAGVILVVGTDAHAVEELDFVRYGVDQARRGWCRASDIANTLPLARLRTRLARHTR